MSSSASRTSAEAASSLDASLGRYAVAATAALAGASAAEAQITPIFGSGAFSLSGDNDSNSFILTIGDSGPPVLFSGVRSTTTTTTGLGSTTSGGPPDVSVFFYGSIDVSGANAVRFLTEPSSLVAVNLAFGDPVSGAFDFDFGGLFGTSSFNGYGNFSPVQGGSLQGFVGFRADIGGEFYLGWLRVEVSRDLQGRPSGLALAPEDGIVGAFAPEAQGITAGAIPEPATAATGLGLLALGAAGLRRRRALLAGKN